MENAPVISGLLSKRASIEGESAGLERGIPRHRSELMQIDATILLFAPNLTRAKRDVTRFQRSAHAMVGELARRCQTAFREAEGKRITANEIAVQAMKDKNLVMGDGALRQDITRRFIGTLTRMLKTGNVTKRGWGADAKWSRPLTDHQPLEGSLLRSAGGTDMHSAAIFFGLLIGGYGLACCVFVAVAIWVSPGDARDDAVPRPQWGRPALVATMLSMPLLFAAGGCAALYWGFMGR